MKTVLSSGTNGKFDLIILSLDLRVETVLEGNAEILRMMELLKAMPGIKDVVWTEIVEVMGRKMSIPSQIVDRL